MKQVPKRFKAPIDIPRIAPHGLFYSDEQKAFLKKLEPLLEHKANQMARIMGIKRLIRVRFNEELTLLSNGQAAAGYRDIIGGWNEQERHLIEIAPEMVMPAHAAYIMPCLAHEVLHAWQCERDFGGNFRKMEKTGIKHNKKHGYSSNPHEIEAYDKMGVLWEVYQVLTTSLKPICFAMNNRYLDQHKEWLNV